MSDSVLQPRFAAGAVLSRSFHILVGGFAPFFAITALVVLPQYLLIWSVQSDTTGEIDFTLDIVLYFIVAWICEAIATAVIIHAVFQALRSRPVSLAASVSAAWRRLFPVALVAMLQIAAVVLGLIFFLVPGFIVIAVLYVAIPACVVERLGPLASLRHSAGLTRGHRWHLFGIFVVVVAVSAVVAVLNELAGAPGDLLYKAVEFVTGVLFSAYFAVTVAVAYHDLRVAKDGVDVDKIAALFE